MWLWSVATAAAATFTVGPQGDFDSVQNAVDAASDGDTVEIGAGAFAVDLRIEVGIALRGAGVGVTRLTPVAQAGSDVIDIHSRHRVTISDLTIDGGGQLRPLQIVLSEAVLERVAFEAPGPGDSGGSLHLDDSDVTLRDCTFAHPANITGDGGHLYALDSVLTVEGSTFDQGVAGDEGGAMRLFSTDATLIGNTFTNNEADAGGAIHSWNGAGNHVVLRDNVFEFNAALVAEGANDDGFGGAATFFGGQLTAENNTFRSNVAGAGGGAIDGGGLNASRVAFNTFEANDAAEGGAIALYNPRGVSIQSNRMVDHTATQGGAIFVGGSGSYELRGNTLCDNSASLGGGLMSNAWNGRLQGIVRNNLIGEQQGVQQGSALLFWGSDVDVAQNSIVNGQSSQGALWVASDANATVTNNLFVGNLGGAIYATEEQDVAASFNLFWMNENTGSNITGLFPLVTDPAFVADSSACGDYRTTSVSPVVDAGDPNFFDDDGTRSDLGAYGGPGASLVLDLDGDGVIEGDCAPYDATRSEGAPELVGDGVDQDCDGLDLCYVDDDGDGVGSDQLRVGDCAEAGLATLTGDCDDTDLERIDNCDPQGLGDTEADRPSAESLPRRWFCAAAPGSVGPSSAGLLGVALLLLGAYRRHSRPVQRCRSLDSGRVAAGIGALAILGATCPAWAGGLGTVGTIGTAGTVVVGQAGDFAELAPAIAAAEPGDVIELTSGDHKANVTIRKELTLRGVGPQTRVIATESTSSAITVDTSAPVTLQAMTIDGNGTQRGLEAQQANLTVIDVVFQGGSGPRDGANLYTMNTDLVMHKCVFASAVSVPGSGAHAYFDDSVVLVEDSVFSFATAGGSGGAVHLESTDGTFVRTTFEGNAAASGGALGAISGLSNTLTLQECVFDTNAANNNQGGYEGFGGAAVVTGGQATILQSTFRSNRAAFGGGALDLTFVRDGLVQDNVFEDNSAVEEGGALALYNPQGMAIRRNTLLNHTASRAGGAVLLSGHGTFDLQGNRICSASSEDDGGALAFSAWQGVLAGTVRHNVISNVSAVDSGAVLVSWAAEPTITQNTFVQSETPFASLLFDGSSRATLHNNVLVALTGGALWAQSSPSVAASYNLYWNNDIDVTGQAADTPIDLDPGFSDKSLNSCETSYRPRPGSPLTDAGDPKVLDDDGTRSDLGAYGGPGASLVYDLDGDGVIDGDCAPFDASRTTGIDEIVGDGIDQDCDGLDLCYVDADGDGAGATELVPGHCDDAGLAAEGGDCDDSDATRIDDCSTGDTGVVEPDTGAPPDEEAPPEPLPGVWFCGHLDPSRAPTGLAAVVLLGVIARRRRCRST